MVCAIGKKSKKILLFLPVIYFVGVFNSSHLHADAPRHDIIVLWCMILEFQHHTKRAWAVKRLADLPPNLRTLTGAFQGVEII